MSQSISHKSNAAGFPLTVVLTRGRDQTQSLADNLAAMGLNTLSLPFIKIVNEELSPELESELARLASSHFEWLVLPSVNAVSSLAELLRQAGLSLPSGQKIAVQGPGTAAAVLKILGRAADLAPEQHIAEALGASLLGVTHSADRVLIAAAREGRAVLAETLGAGGRSVKRISTYCTKTETPTKSELQALAAYAPSDLIFAFLSPSAVKSAVAALDRSFPGLLKQARILSIGPTTSQAAIDLGFEVWREAERHNEAGLLAALRTCLPSGSAGR